MQVGFVRDLSGKLYPYSPIYVESRTRKSEIFTAIIDTVYNGWIALPANDIAMLELEMIGEDPVLFGNFTTEFVRTFRAQIIWNDQRRFVTVHETGNEATIGMNPWRDNNLSLDACENGEIRLEPISAQT